jgi:hypothetical protein
MISTLVSGIASKPCLTAECDDRYRLGVSESPREIGKGES